MAAEAEAPAIVPTETVTDDERLSTKRKLYNLHKETGAPESVVAAVVMKTQERANDLGAPINVIP